MQRYCITVTRKLVNLYLQTFGSKTQFRRIGCQEAQHTSKRALLLRRQHGIQTYALFVDLVKAFDTVEPPLLFRSLRRYGIPDTLVRVVEKTYRDCSVSC